MRAALLLAIGCLLLAACQTQRPLYYWGNYETVMYLAYAKPEKASLEVQRAKLEEDLASGKNRGLAANPGLHAQLGYVYFQLGQPQEAIREFELEKKEFPESAVFMDRLIERAKGMDKK